MDGFTCRVYPVAPVTAAQISVAEEEVIEELDSEAGCEQVVVPDEG